MTYKQVLENKVNDNIYYNKSYLIMFKKLVVAQKLVSDLIFSIDKY